MNKTALLIALGLSFQAEAQTTYPVHLTWERPTMNEDGTPYLNQDGYRIFWGTTIGNYPNSFRITDPNDLNHTLLLAPNRWYFVATAVNTLAVESDYSNIAEKAVGPQSTPPVLSVPDVPVRTISPDVFSDQKQDNIKVMRLVGEVPTGTQCIGTEAIMAQGVVYHAVDADLVIFATLTRPDIVYARCE